MTCYDPQACWLDVETQRMSFKKEPPVLGSDRYVRSHVDCRKCLGCLEKKAREIATRIGHEASMHKHKSFLTLTYADEHLPPHGSLRKRHLQLFMKRLRKAFPRVRIKFYGIGEYGSKTLRAHYHVCVCGVDFSDDRKLYGDSHKGHRMFESPTLDALWGMGRCTIQALTHETAGYAARYMVSKLDTSALWAGPAGGDEHWFCDPLSGNWLRRQKEFCLASRRPGLGKAWLEVFSRDVFKVHDSGELKADVVLPGGFTSQPPRYYDKVLRDWCEEDYQDMKEARRASMMTLSAIVDSSPKRLSVREEVHAARSARKPRDTL